MEKELKKDLASLFSALSEKEKDYILGLTRALSFALQKMNRISNTHKTKISRKKI